MKTETEKTTTGNTNTDAANKSGEDTGTPAGPAATGVNPELEALKKENSRHKETIDYMNGQVQELTDANATLSEENDDLRNQLNEALASAGKPGVHRSKPIPPNAVHARRGNAETHFSQEAWEMLGADKAGWSVITETPEEIAKLRAKQGK